MARRTRQLALLGVLGLNAGARLRLVIAESLVLGAVGSAAGLALGTGLVACTALALAWPDVPPARWPGQTAPPMPVRLWPSRGRTTT